MTEKTYKLEFTGLQLELLLNAAQKYRAGILFNLPSGEATELWRAETDKVLKMLWAELYDWGKDVEEKS